VKDDEGRGPGGDHGPEESGALGKALPTSAISNSNAAQQDLFGETPEAPQPSGLLRQGLKHDAQAKAARLAQTRPGMAGIASPELGTCRECCCWAGAAGDKRDSWGDLKPAVCNKYGWLTPVRSRLAVKDRKLPPSNCACEYFEPNRFPPVMGRNG